MRCCAFTTYFAAAVYGFVREHVVIDLRHRWLPGDESAAVVDLAGRQVQGCVHGCRKEGDKLCSHIDILYLFPVDREVILGQERFFWAVTEVMFFFFSVSGQQREKASLVQPSSLESQLEGVAGQGKLDWLLKKMLCHCLFLAHQPMVRNTDDVPGGSSALTISLIKTK